MATHTAGAEPDIEAWANGCALNPARLPAEQRTTSAVRAATARLAAIADEGLSRMAELATAASNRRIVITTARRQPVQARTEPPAMSRMIPLIHDE